MSDESDERRDALQNRAEDGIDAASDEEGSVTFTKVPDLIAADKYLRGRTSQSGGGLPIRLGKLQPPSALG
jgi:hypothetical protein